jgi:hypothetical protein
LIPRHAGDWPRNDDIYNEIHDGELRLSQVGDVEMHVDDEGRVARSMEEMAEEAATLAALLT